MAIRFVCFDFDGVFSDCKFYVNINGVHSKGYNGKDGYSIKMLKDNGIKTALLTAHDSPCIKHICKLNHFNKLDYVNKGSRNKIEVLIKWKEELGLEWINIAYIGDDISDIKCLQKVGLAGCPSDAIPEVKAVCNFISQYGGGAGAVREFTNYILEYNENNYIISPHSLINKYPTTDEIRFFVKRTKNEIINIMNGTDDRFLVIVGPCSVHNVEELSMYIVKLKEMVEKYKHKLLIIMRAYMEKPRTIGGWKGLMNDPRLDGGNDISAGVEITRKLFLYLNSIGIGIAYEFLNFHELKYIKDLVSWGCIGSRTSQSQIHRNIASQLDIPFGIKNDTSGNVKTAVESVKACSLNHSFIDVTDDCKYYVSNTFGNKNCHVVLRGGHDGNKYISNYGPSHIDKTLSLLEKYELKTKLMVDCSHGNSGKQHLNQLTVLDSLIFYNKSHKNIIKGYMIESYINSGNQKLTNNLKFGVSITDECVDLDTTDVMLCKLSRSCPKVISAL